MSTPPHTPYSRMSRTALRRELVADSLGVVTAGHDIRRPRPWGASGCLHMRNHVHDGGLHGGYQLFVSFIQREAVGGAYSQGSSSALDLGAGCEEFSNCRS